MSAGAIADLFVLLSAKDMGLIAKFGEGGAAGERMAVQVAAAMREVEASVAQVAESTRMVVTAGNEMAVSWERDLAAMKASTAGLAEGMAAAEAKAATSMAELDAATAAQTKRFSLLGEASGISNKALMGAGVVAAAAGLEFAHMAGDFNMATTRLVTSAGETQANLDMVRQGILGMAGAVGYSADELAAAMYKVESGGQHGAAGLKVLQAAAEGAKTENADLKVVADALTSAMVDYKFPADQAATVTSKLVAATSQGKMTFEELAGSMSAILPVASANHVALDDILGDLASMTVHGMSAQQASQNLADAIRHMAAPTQMQSKELAILGINAQDLSSKLGTSGLSGTIDLIGSHIKAQMGPGTDKVILDLGTALNGLSPKVQELAGHVLDGSMTMKEYTAAAKGLDVISAKQAMSFAALAGTTHTIGTEQISGQAIMQSYTKAMRDAMGDATGLNVALMIGGENAGITANAIKVVSGASAEAGGHVKGWAEIQGEFNTKVAQAKDGLGALAISVGEKLLPVLTPLVGILAAGAAWLSRHQMAAGILAAILGGVMVVGLVAATVAMWGYVTAATAGALATIGITAPLWLVVAVVAAVGIAVYEVITHWSGIADFFKGVWHAVTGVFSAAWDAIKSVIHGIAQAWDSFVGGFTNPAAKLADSVKGFDRFFINLGSLVKKGFDAVVHIFTMSPEEMAHALGYGLGKVTRVVVDFVTSLPQRIGDLKSLMVRKGAEMLAGMEQGVENGAQAVWAFFKALPGRILAFTVTAAVWLVTTGRNIVMGAVHGIEDAASAVWNFFKALPGNVLDFFTNAPSWLYNAGADILRGLWNGFTSLIGNILSGIGNFIKSFIQGFLQGFGIASPSTIFTGIGRDIMQGLWNGLQQMFGQLAGVAGQLFHVIVDPFANSASWLVSAGYNICVGIYNGISSGWSMLTNMVSNLAHSLINTAKSALGISSPSKLFSDEVGQWIGPGLAIGIDASAHHAIEAATRLVQQVSRAAQGTATGGVGLDLFTAGFGALPGAGGGIGVSGAGLDLGGTHINLNVQGHVWTTQDLIKEVQTQLLRHGIRNTTAGIDYTFA